MWNCRLEGGSEDLWASYGDGLVMAMARACTRAFSCGAFLLRVGGAAERLQTSRSVKRQKDFVELLSKWWVVWEEGRGAWRFRAL